MIESFLMAVGGIITLMIFWTVIQSYWGRTFEEYLEDDDVLAGRSKCGNCNCTTACSRNITHPEI